MRGTVVKRLRKEAYMFLKKAKSMGGRIDRLPSLKQVEKFFKRRYMRS